jgi:plastocyanin
MLIRVSAACGLMLALLAGSGQSARSAEWGSIEGQFVLDGKIEVPDKFPAGAASVAAKAATCAKVAIPDDTLIVNPKNNGVANVFIYLQKAPADVHPDLKAVPTTKKTLDQPSCRFIPHGSTLRVGQPLNVINTDTEGHNTHTNPVAGNAENFSIAAGDKAGKEVTFAMSETLPVKINCDIHSWMETYVLVKDHPYVAVTDADGKFMIENLPVGEHTFRVWHERQGYLNREYKVKVVAGKNPPLATEKIPAAKLVIKKP